MNDMWIFISLLVCAFYLHVSSRYTKPHGRTCTRFCPARGEQQCAVSTTCSISRQASPSSRGVQTVLFPPQWYSTCSQTCSSLLPATCAVQWCTDTRTHINEKPGHITVVTWLKTDGVNKSISSSSACVESVF